MTIHTIAFVILTSLSLVAAYLIGRPAPTSTDELQSSPRVGKHACEAQEDIT